ncbi:hypothetical protein [Nitrospina watsonii]|uniref:Uncharacterized protein n=1 Tax=Nitrospina watsonii TaxID=1323948 RepID=A0ABM9HI55_9BACT|nr:hypothetical protein [Nitrospina watsonii]CAI2719755.1 conserved protein of unknown function [Nitrospina watsonii]
MNWLRGKKTYMVAAMMVAISILNIMSGEESLGTFVSSPHFNTLLEGIGLGTLRAGVTKSVFR